MMITGYTLGSQSMNYRIKYNGNLFYLLEVIAKHLKLEQRDLFNMTHLEGDTIIFGEARIELNNYVILVEGGLDIEDQRFTEID